MEDIEKAYYEAQFENSFLKVKGNEFQNFFNKLMGMAYKTDYMPCRPWGNKGDQKNDGFLKSERRLFQVYAPNSMMATEAIKKINEDFEGAKKHWIEYFDKWSFVHNARDGMPPHVQKLILDLEKDNPSVKLDLWGYEELLEIFCSLERQDIESWFGHAPNSQTKSQLGFEDLRIVLETIESKKCDPGKPIKQVPPKKIEANQLSDDIATLLKAGMSNTTLLEDFFSQWHDPTFGEKIATAFREKYRGLREHSTPNEIFHELTT